MQKKILIVDDDESILDALSLILTDADFTVEATSRGSTTMTAVDRFKPDLILLDVLISGWDGRNICRKLKAEDTTKDIPIIMISAHPSAQRSVVECGANDFIAKPFDTNELLYRVCKQLVH